MFYITAFMECLNICHLHNVGAGPENDDCTSLKLAMTFAMCAILCQVPPECFEKPTSQF